VPRQLRPQVGEFILQHRDLTSQGADFPLTAGKALVRRLPSIDRLQRAGDSRIRLAAARFGD
jgi:hypothetical protein